MAVENLVAAGAWVGRGLPRFEDEALLRGRGRFPDDLDPVPGAHHAAVLRPLRRVRGGADPHPVALDLDDDQISLMVYTSGTTGKPKVVPRTHRAGALSEVIHHGYRHRDRSLGVMPLLALVPSSEQRRQAVAVAQRPRRQGAQKLAGRHLPATLKQLDKAIARERPRVVARTEAGLCRAAQVS
jgi:hypothetical protein